MIEYIKGDLRDTDCLLIAHGVNCQNVMGSGVAKALFDKWPKVKYAYHDYFEEFNCGEDGEKFLGDIDTIQIHRGGPVIVNCFTQQHFGNDGKRYLSYDALYKCMENLKDACEYYQVNEVAMPKIGCGLAGGNWEIVKEIILTIFPIDFKVKVYSL